MTMQLERDEAKFEATLERHGFMYAHSVFAFNPGTVAVSGIAGAEVPVADEAEDFI
jgi:hypothetical protein